MSMVRYARYTQLLPSNEEWLGSIPSSWKVVRLKTLFKIRKDIAGRLGYDVLSVTQKGLKPKDLTSGEGQLAMDYSKYQLVSVGDFVMNQMDLLTGFVDIAAQEGVTSPDYRVFIPLFSNRMNNRYYLYIFQMCYHQRIFYPLGHGSAQLGRWRLPRKAFEEFALPVPSKEEQTQIAKFLDYETAKIDALIAKQQQLIALLQEKRQAVISHAVTKGLNPAAPLRDSGVEWLGQVPAHWEVKRIKNLAEIISKGTTPSTVGKDMTDTGIRFIKGENVGKGLAVSESPEFYISQDTDRLLYRSRLKQGDVLVIIAGATTGLCSVVEANVLPANTNQAVSFIRPLLLSHSRFIARWLSTEFAQRVIWMGAVQAAQPNLSMEDLGNIPIALPPAIELRQILKKIDAQVEQFDRLIEQANTLDALLQERRTALIAAAVTGKIDVRGWQPPVANAEGATP